MDPQLLRKYTKQNIDKNGNTLLHKAVKETNFVLLFKAALMETSVNKQNTDGYSALHYAVKHGNIDMVESVLECGVSPLLKTKIGETAKDIAIRQKRADIGDLLDRYGDGLDFYIRHKNTSQTIALLHQWVNLDNVTRSMVKTEHCDLFLDNMRSLSLEYYQVQNHFIHLVASDNYEEVSAILDRMMADKSICINSIHATNGATPLSVAIRNGNYKMVNLLLELGANPAIRLKDGTPLTHYCWDIGAPFQIILHLLHDEATWHMRSPTYGLTILFSLIADPSITSVHVHKLLELTECALLIDRDSEGRDVHAFCLLHNRLDLIATVHESIAELMSKRNGKLTLIRLAVASLGRTILEVPEAIFAKFYDGEILSNMLATFGQFVGNLPTLETEASKLFDAVRRGHLADVKVHNIADFINKSGRTALHEAILNDKYDITVWLLAERPGLRLIGDLNNRYPLHYAYAVACRYGKRYVHLLLASSDRGDLEKLTDVNNNIPSALDVESIQLSTNRLEDI